jgi:prolyl-tRNA synthetase
MNEPSVVQAAETLYRGLQGEGLDVLLDDRDLRAGAKFKDADLLGTPLRITVGSRSLEKGLVEIKLRSEKESALVPLEEAPGNTREHVKKLYDSLT